MKDGDPVEEVQLQHIPKYLIFANKIAIAFLAVDIDT